LLKAIEFTQPAQLKDELHSQLAILQGQQQCALLDYPEHFNVGDHLLWIAALSYLSLDKGSPVRYCASVHDFDQDTMRRSIGDGPIYFCGGGSFGDLWPVHQLFRERVIADCHQNPIVILPQTIYFQDDENKARASKIFNAHPNLTIFVRDQASYELANDIFHQCRIIKAPDTVFHLSDIDLPEYTRKYDKHILYLNRNDAELKQNFDVGFPGFSVTRKNWFAFEEVYSTKTKILRSTPSVWHVPGAARIYRELWQRRLSNQELWRSRQAWCHKHPLATLIKSAGAKAERSWAITHDTICQLMPYSAVVTDRLHGHIVSVILKIPNVFLPNSYGKNERFYREWTHGISSSRYVEQNEELQGALSSLLEKP